MGIPADKDARILLRTTKDARALLSKAATLNDTDLSSFVLTSATEKAHAILQDHASISLSATAQAQLAKVLRKQLAPTKAMDSLRKLPRLKVRSR